MSCTHVAILGANGFIGKHLTRVLMQNSQLKITLFGRSPSNDFKDRLPYHQLDLNNTSQLEKYFKETEIVYYLASDSIPSSSWDDPKFDVEKNLLPFIHFLNNGAKHKLRKVVFVSSAGTIYGQSKEKLTEDSDKKPFSPYGITKLAMENYLNYFEVRHNIKHDIFRVSNVYGDGQDTSKGLGIINTFLEKIIKDNNITIYGNGENIRNYICVSDVAKLLSLSISSGADSNIYNLASNDNISINQLVDIIKKIVKEDFKVNYKETRQSDNPAISLDNSKLKASFKDFKFVELSEGIKQTYNHIKEKLGVKNNQN
ncbi:MAG: NAD-dependent epimerase/dehydratase family protein [Bacteroidia bacterium]|jgi:UDP-glucose 4-epimerase|nr:NAD-dependent epimerase/dehydratase family protein [Sphingobacteriaceae bacterium]MBP9069054.1 NAD-dependent epimerase/dehydratase family protein [Bacteroidia bacterium]